MVPYVEPLTIFTFCKQPVISSFLDYYAESLPCMCNVRKYLPVTTVYHLETSQKSTNSVDFRYNLRFVLLFVISHIVLRDDQVAQKLDLNLKLYGEKSKLINLKQHGVNILVGDVKANPRDLYRYINSQEKDTEGIPL